MICPWILPAKYIFFTPETSVLVYYSHITSFIISLTILIFINLSKQKSANKNYFSLLLISFIIWVIFNLILWTNNNSSIIIFFWSFFGLLTGLISIFSYWLYRSFVLNKENNWKYILFPLLIMIPILLITPTKFNLNDFDIDICGIAGNANEGVFPYYFFGIAFFFFFLILINFSLNFKSFIIKNNKQSLFFGFGIIFFMLSFFTTSFFASYLAEHGLIQDFGLEQYGLFGMTAFLAIITFLIVRFKAFNIKLIGAQALVWALVIMIGSEFLFVENLTNQILVGVTLVISSIFGLILVRSVKKEVTLREQLEIANRNQESLIHFVSHQLKGFFTKSKMIFAGLIQEDFGKTTDEIKDMAQVGLDSDNNAVSMIQDILGASNLKKGTTNYNFKLADLTVILKKVIDSFSKDMEKKGLKLELNISNLPLTAMVDETQITQVFKNLLDNSLKYTLTGQIKVSLGRSPVENKKALFYIQDTGVGLSPGDKAKLFTEGGKGDESLKININSTGYGLYISKNIVESHKGRIWAESAGRGQGSKFLVELNLVE